MSRRVSSARRPLTLLVCGVFAGCGIVSGCSGEDAAGAGAGGVEPGATQSGASPGSGSAEQAGSDGDSAGTGATSAGSDAAGDDARGELGSSDGTGSETGSSETGSSETGSSETGSSEPGSSEPGSSEPGSSEPGSSEPGSSEGAGDGESAAGSDDSPGADSNSDPGGGASSGGDASSGDASSAPSADGSFDDDGASAIAPGSGTLGDETTCDGVDDDADGVIDDVDVAGDGVCDCLSIATLGLHGEWGGGDVTSGWLPSRLDEEIVHLGDAELTRELLDPIQVLLVRDVSPMNNPGLSYSAAEAEALWDWVRAGGGLMTVIGYSDPTEINNVNTLLDAFSLRYGADQIVQGSGQAVPVSEWFEHPLTAGVTQVGADNGYPALGQGATIAAQDGFDLGKAVVIGDGHVLVWGDEWITYEDEWSGSSTYQVDQFWQNALRWLTRANECQVPGG